MDSHPLRGSGERTDAPDVRGLFFSFHFPVVITQSLHRTFLTLRNPGIALRALVLAAQGVFYNIFCTSLSSLLKLQALMLALLQVLSYLISPGTCHRFVGYLEEEAVVTYTHAIEELERGRLPKWYVNFDEVWWFSWL